MAYKYALSLDEAPQIAKSYAEHLQGKINVLGVYLFGSCARGTFTADSDIDIAVVSDSFSGIRIDDAVQLMLLKCDIDYRIEPHPFLPDDFTPDNPMADEIIKTGIRIA